MKRDLIWNYLSIIVMAVTGLIMNTVIAVTYGSEIFGIFSETYAWYMILSQLSVWGIHMAIVKFVPEKDDAYGKGGVLKTGIVLVIITSLVITLGAETVVFFLDNIAWKQYMQIAFTGLVMLSINKVLLNYLNALSKMTAFAIFTSVRYAFFGLWIWILALFRVDPLYLTTVFPITEIIGLMIILLYFWKRIPIKGNIEKRIFTEMASFGTKLIPSYMVLELNTKIDVVCLGFLAEDVSQIGIYTFAIFFTEGFYLLYVTIRKIVNPEISRANHIGKLNEHIIDLKKRLRSYLTFGGLIAYALVAVGYWALCIIMNRIEYRFGVVYILIICLAIVINGKYVVLGDLLAQIGLPLDESMANVVTVACNLILNIVFIVIFGVIGAAIATAVSHFVFSFMIRKRLYKSTGIKL